jgi:hypothetical protein
MIKIYQHDDLPILQADFRMATSLRDCMGMVEIPVF